MLATKLTLPRGREVRARSGSVEAQEKSAWRMTYTALAGTKPLRYRLFVCLFVCFIQAIHGIRMSRTYRYLSFVPCRLAILHV
jgi:hypothetical protein